PRGSALRPGAQGRGDRGQDARRGRGRILPPADALRSETSRGGGAREARRAGGAVPVRAPGTARLVRQGSLNEDRGRGPPPPVEGGHRAVSRAAGGSARRAGRGARGHVQSPVSRVPVSGRESDRRSRAASVVSRGASAGL